jgi:hypothetical protein
MEVGSAVPLAHTEVFVTGLATDIVRFVGIGCEGGSKSWGEGSV